MYKNIFHLDSMDGGIDPWFAGCAAKSACTAGVEMRPRSENILDPHLNRDSEPPGRALRTQRGLKDATYCERNTMHIR